MPGLPVPCLPQNAMAVSIVVVRVWLAGVAGLRTLRKMSLLGLTSMSCIARNDHI